MWQGWPLPSRGCQCHLLASSILSLPTLSFAYQGMESLPFLFTEKIFQKRGEGVGEHTQVCSLQLVFMMCWCCLHQRSPTISLSLCCGHCSFPAGELPLLLLVKPGNALLPSTPVLTLCYPSTGSEVSSLGLLPPIQRYKQI